MEFPPDFKDVVPDDVKALLKLVGITMGWNHEWLAVHLQMINAPYVIDQRVELEMLAKPETARIVVQDMINHLGAMRAR